MTSTQTAYPKAHTGRRVAFIRYRDLPNGPQTEGIITGVDLEQPASQLLIRLDGARSNLHVRPNYEGLTYLDEVVPVPELPVGPFTPVANDLNGFYERDGLVVAAVGEDGEDLVAITDDRDKAFAAVVGHGTQVGYDMDDFEREDLDARWVVFEWQPDDAECTWFMNPAAEGDDQAVHVYSLSTEL
ncbi:hypothetical protein [Streptomyces sp. NPDC005548]|uniref:hypothetical protein n=1 Tax=Streptomyces sp. NPDC005548 TaxID=3364724 RepID=UPI0036A3F84F